MPADLSSISSIANAIALVLRPHAEVVVHDLKAGTIAHITGTLSKRSVGDSSLTELADVGAIAQDVIGPYAKINWDGRKLKSISAAIFAADGCPSFLLCINIDVTMFEALQSLSRSFLRVDTGQDDAAPLFASDWREDINDVVGQFATDIGATPGRLTLEQRIELVRLLDARGHFEIRNAVSYIAGLLQLSRATLYKTLKAARTQSTSGD